MDFHAQQQQLRGVRQLARQLKTSIRAGATPNTESISGDISALFERIEAEAAKPIPRVLVVVIRANVAALERLSTDAEALRTADKVLFDQFIVEARRLLALYPILRVIEDPHNERLLPDEAIPEGERFVEQLVAILSDPEVERAIGPSLPGVTRDLMAYPWESPKQRIVGIAALARETRQALENPPRWVEGTGKYADLLAKLSKAYEILAPLLRFLG